MRSVKQLPVNIPKESDLSKFPDSTVINETETDAGTPVVREIYGDILTNFYKLVRTTGGTLNGLEDNEPNGYQIVDALKKLTNVLNDVEQPMGLSGTVFSIPLNLALLPDKYVCVVRSAEAYVSGVAYTFKGNGPGNEEYTFTSSGFISGDVLVLVIDHAGVRAYNLGQTGAAGTDEVFTPFGTPLAFNNGSKVYYQAQGILFSDKPEVYDLQSAIRVLASDGTMLVYEMMIMQGHVVCFAYSPAVQTYRFYKFLLTNLATPVMMSVTGTGFPTGVNKQPNVYTDGTNIYITNNTGNNDNAYVLDTYVANVAAGTITVTGSVAFNAAFEKTTNAAITGGFLFTLVNSILYKYNINSGARTYVAEYPGPAGVLFRLGSSVYFSGGDVAKKWVL